MDILGLDVSLFNDDYKTKEPEIDILVKRNIDWMKIASTEGSIIGVEVVGEGCNGEQNNDENILVAQQLTTIKMRHILSWVLHCSSFLLFFFFFFFILFFCCIFKCLCLLHCTCILLSLNNWDDTVSLCFRYYWVQTVDPDQITPYDQSDLGLHTLFLLAGGGVLGSSYIILCVMLSNKSLFGGHL